MFICIIFIESCKMKVLYYLTLFFSFLVHSQHYTSRWYGMDEGLPQNGVKDIIKDKYGFIWLATDGDLVRYDGRQFLLFNNFKIKNLNFGNFLKTAGGEIIAFNNNEEDCVLLKERNVAVLKYQAIAKIELTANGKLYKRYFKNRFTSVFFPETNCYFVKTASGIYTFYSDRILFSNGRETKNILSHFSFNRLKNSFVLGNALYLPDPKNRTTLILRNGKVFYDNEATLYNDPLSKIYWHETSQQIFVINKGNIYIAAADTGKPRFRFLLQYKNIEKQLFSSMYYDEESQQLYLGNLVKGLNIITLSHFHTLQRNIPYSFEVVYDALPFGSDAVITKYGFQYTKDKVEKAFSASLQNERRFSIYDSLRNIIYVDVNKIHIRYKEPV